MRGYGSHFIVQINHENPETASVIRQNAFFAVVDVVAGDARYQAWLGTRAMHGSMPSLRTT